MRQAEAVPVLAVSDTTRRGDLAELEITVALVRAGKRVLRPLSSDSRYDLVIDEGTGRFTRVQCKSGVLHAGRITFRTYSMNASNPGRTYRGEVDAFGIYCAATRDAYLVPMSAIDACETMASLRVAPTRNGQHSGVRLAAEFRIDRQATDL
jgi:hypothetical protein